MIHVPCLFICPKYGCGALIHYFGLTVEFVSVGEKFSGSTYELRLQWCICVAYTVRRGFLSVERRLDIES